MNREQRRRIDKELKRRYGEENYSDIKSKAITETINISVKEQVDKFVGNFIAAFEPVLMANKISKLRANKIMQELADEADKRYGAGEDGVPRVQDKFIDNSKIEEIMVAGLKRHGVVDAEAIAGEIYEELMREGEDI